MRSDVRPAAQSSSRAFLRLRALAVAVSLLAVSAPAMAADGGTEGAGAAEAVIPEASPAAVAAAPLPEGVAAVPWRGWIAVDPRTGKWIDGRSAGRGDGGWRRPPAQRGRYAYRSRPGTAWRTWVPYGPRYDWRERAGRDRRPDGAPWMTDRYGPRPYYGQRRDDGRYSDGWIPAPSRRYDLPRAYVPAPVWGWRAL